MSGDRPPPSRDDVLARPELFDVFVQVEASFAWTSGALAAHGWLDWLARLPLECRRVLADGTRVLGVHASPGLDGGAGITPHRPDDELPAALAGADADIVCAGHTHQATDRRIDDVRAVNLGSISNPIVDDPRATYALIHSDRHGHHVEHRRVVYDTAQFLDRLERSGHPAADYIASFQRGEQTRFQSLRPGAPIFAT